MRYFFLLLFLLMQTISLADDVMTRSNQITKNLRCLVCDGQSVYESNSNFANDIKKYVKKEIVKNKTDHEIYNFLKRKYGESIMFNPSVTFKSIALWLVPILFFFMGIYILLRRIRA